MSSSVSKMAPFVMGVVLGFGLTSIFKIGAFENLPQQVTILYECQVTLAPSTTNDSDVETQNTSEIWTKAPNPGEKIHSEIQTNATVAHLLEKRVRIVCWVLTRPANATDKLNAIRKTWGKRCTKLLIFSSANSTEDGIIALPNTGEGRDWLWAKTKEAFKYIYQHHLDEGDWFLKADDDTFVIMENLRYLLYGLDPMKPTYFGCRFKDAENSKFQGYMSGGAGYVLSKESLIRFVEIAVNNKDLCDTSHDGPEDWNLGICLEKVGVKAMDTRDTLQLHRFLPLNPSLQINLERGILDWYWAMTWYPQKTGFDCCSDYTISFHYVTPEEMYEMEFFLYHVKTFGISVLYNVPTRKLEAVYTSGG